MSIGGLCIKLSEDYPTTITVGDEKIEIYQHYLKSGSPRARIVAGKNVKIVGPHRFVKDLVDRVGATLDVKVIQDNTNGI